MPVAYLFNNCQNLDHTALYGGDAMFDLYVQGREDAMARSLSPGDECWVLKYQCRTVEGRKQVVISRFVYTGRRIEPSAESPGGKIWVLDGRLEEQLVLPKVQAARHAVCWRLFDKRGHLKELAGLRI